MALASSLQAIARLTPRQLTRVGAIATTRARGRADNGSVGSAPERCGRGSAVVEFALVAPLAVAVALAVAQLALFLYERNVVMGSLSEGARIAAVEGRTVADGERSARELLQQSLGGRVATAVPVRGTVDNGLVVLRADGVLPSFVPLVPGLSVSMTASMHKEERLRQDQLGAGGTGAQGTPAGEAPSGEASVGNAGGGP
jgi:hypothetical protein